MTDLLVKLFVRDSANVQNPAVRERYGVMSGGVGIVLNLLLAAGKFLAGLLSASIAITADAFNNLTDAGSSVVTLVGFKLAGQKADSDHPFGHGRMEYLSGLVVSFLILSVGLELLKGSVGKILQPEKLSFSWVSIGILAVSILVKLWMCLFNRTLGKRISSASMQATAADSLSDMVATSAVLVGTLVGHFSGYSIDGWVGVLVALFILRAGWGAARDTLNPLLGQSPDPTLVREIHTLVLSHSEVVGMHDLIIHDYGPGRCMMSFHAEVPVGADIMEAHDAIDHIEREIQEKFRIQASVHMDPIATDDTRVTECRHQVLTLVRTIDPEMSIHDFRMTDGPQHTNLIFDVVVPHRCPLTDDEVRRRIAEAVKIISPSYFTVVEIDRSYVHVE